MKDDGLRNSPVPLGKEASDRVALTIRSQVAQRFLDRAGPASLATVVRSGSLKAAVVQACLFDPDSHNVYLAFAAHWGFTPLPTSRRPPRQMGSKSAAAATSRTMRLKVAVSAASRRTIRFCGTEIALLPGCASTVPRVAKSGCEVEQRAPRAPAGRPFRSSRAPSRTVHTDGHVEVGGAFYPVPLVLLGQRVRVRWDGYPLRVFDGDSLVMVPTRVTAGVSAQRAGEAEASSRQQDFVDRLVGQCERVGPAVKQWPTRRSPCEGAAPFASVRAPSA